MMPVALHPPPRARDVLLEQVRAAGVALRGPAAAALALGALATLLFTIEIVGEGEVVDFHPARWLVPGLLGFLLPLGVWKGEERFGAGFLWTLPVDRRRHALAKVFAGWVWLMSAVAVFVLWLLGLTLLSGGNILAEETLRLLPSASLAAPGHLDVPGIQTVDWTPHPVLWLVPFTAATATYLVASALALGVTLRGIVAAVAGAFVLLFLIGAAGEVANSQWLIFAPSRLVRALFYEPYGLATLLTATSELPSLGAAVTSGQTWAVGRGVPDLGRWATATLLWTGGGLVALWLAASRHRERRPG